MLTFGLFENYSARNSSPVWHAIKQGLTQAGVKWSSHDADAQVAVIWSQVWAGRMKPNQEIWHQFRDSGRPVIVAEVGMLRRGHTWKLGINGTGRHALWGQGLDPDRPRRLGLQLRQWHKDGTDILVCVQRQDSEQWCGQPPVIQWLDGVVSSIQEHSDRPIRIRCHPRQPLDLPSHWCRNTARRLPHTYDSYDLDQALKSAWAVVNWNSGPGCQAIMAGVPAVVGDSSLAWPVANHDWSQLSDPLRPPREQWLIDVSHTEWTCTELASGMPFRRLLLDLESL